MLKYNQMFRQISKLSLFSFIGAAYYFLSIFLVQFLRTDRNFIRDSLSSYAVGHMGFVLEIGFVLVTITELTISFNLFKIGHKFSSFLLFLCGLGGFLIFSFPSAPICPQTLNDRLHVIGCIPHFLLFPWVIFFVGQKSSLNSFKNFSIFMFSIIFILEVVVTVFFFGHSQIGFNYFGIIEKILCIFNTIWLLTISYKTINFFNFASLFSNENNN